MSILLDHGFAGLLAGEQRSHRKRRQLMLTMGSDVLMLNEV